MRKLLALALLLVLAPQAHAGNWSVTRVDPLPAQFSAGQTYLVGYWVQPVTGGQTSLTLRSGGQELVYPGVALAESGHYSAAISVPSQADWDVIATLSPFDAYVIGALHVPGGLELFSSSDRGWLIPVLGVVGVVCAAVLVRGAVRLGRRWGRPSRA